MQTESATFIKTLTAKQKLGWPPTNRRVAFWSVNFVDWPKWRAVVERGEELGVDINTDLFFLIPEWLKQHK